MLFKGGWNESATNGAGKFIFDIGCESHGEYIPVEKRKYYIDQYCI